MTDFLSIDPYTDINWDEFVEASPDGWVWGLAGWQRMIQRVPEWGLRPLSFEMSENGRRMAIMPLHLNSVNTAASSGWGLVGPMLAPDLTWAERNRCMEAVLTHARDIAVQAGASSLQLGSVAVTRTRLSAPNEDNTFLQYDFDDQSGLTKVVPLDAGEDALWSSFSANARQEIRRAKRLNCRVEQVSWRDHLDLYYEVHQETYSRTGVSAHPKGYFSGIAEEMAPAGRSVLWAGFSENGDVIAYHNDAAFGSGCLYHTGCARSEALKTGINYLLMWTALRGAIARNQSFFEIGEIFPDVQYGKQKGLTVFKSKFGGHIHKTHKSITDLSVVEEPASSVKERWINAPVAWLRRQASMVRK